MAIVFPLARAVVLSYCIHSVLASVTCQKLLISGITIEAPLSANYTTDQFEYWSSACGGLLPGCILVPDSASQVSEIVTTLLENNESFAVKSGGHNPNPYFSSIPGGPLINLKSLNQVIYDAASSTAKVGGGNRWSAVVQALEPFNVTVVGGRIGHVGVGGYLTGGGLSYLSTQYGWAADSIVEAEVVLANGTIVTASPSTNIDLWRVLRGGGNNFGIVTTFTLRTYPLGLISGGLLILPSNDTVDAQVLTAVRDFTEYYPDDKAAIIATHEITFSSPLNVWIIFLFYDGPVVPDGTFTNFTKIGGNSTLSRQSYYNFVSAEDDFVITGQVYMIATETSPLPSESVGLEVMGSYHDHWVAVANANADVPGLTGTLALQPLPKRLAQKALANGGDLIALDDCVDRILLEFDYSFPNMSSFYQMNSAIKTLYSGVRDRVVNFVTNGTLPHAYLPLFMNDANFQEDYWARLRPETHAYAKGVRDRYDPHGFFRDRTGGFKL